MSTIEPVPKLLQLVHRRFARWLFLQQIKRTPLPADSPDYEPTYFENCETKIVEMLHQTYALHLPKTCLDAVSQYVHVVVDDMKKDLQGLSVVALITCIARTTKWRDLAASWWSSCWQQAGESVFLTLFEAVMKRSETKGLCVVPEDDLASYLGVWHAAPKDLKINVFTNLSRVHTRKCSFLFSPVIWDLFHPARNLEFLTILFGDFELETRLALWQQNWLDLMAGILPTYLEPLMRLCTDNDRSFEQFKAAWLSNPQIIEGYYCRLISAALIDKLNELLRFYSSDDCKVLQLSILTIRTYIRMHPLPQSCEHLYRISTSEGWLKKALHTAELQDLWRPDEAKLRANFRTLFERGKYNVLPGMLRLFAPEEDARTLEKRYVKSLLLGSSVPYHRSLREWICFVAFTNLPKFDEFLKRVFHSADEVADLKKRMVYAPCTLHGLRGRLAMLKELSKVDNFVRLCLPSGREIAEWEDTFLRDNIRTMKKVRVAQLLHFELSYTETIRWCISSPEKLAKLKSIVSIDELFEIIAQCNSSTIMDLGFLSYDRFYALNLAVNRWYSQHDDRMEFKLRKLRDYPVNELLLSVLLGKYGREYLRQDTEEQKRQVVAKTFAVGGH